MKTGLCERWKEEIRPRQAPNDMPLRPSCYPCGEECRRCAVDRACSAACEFMHRPVGKPTSRKSAINVRHTEWQAGLPLRAAAFQGGDTGTQFGDG